MKAHARKKAVITQLREKKVTKPSRKKAIAAKPAALRKARSSSSGQQAKGIAAPRVISRRYLSPLGKGEISSRRIMAAIKAVKKAHAVYDVEM
jgi:hypothetical protein